MRCSRGRDRMVGGFPTTYAISVYHHKSCEFEPRSWRGVLDATLCDKFVSNLRQIGAFFSLRFLRFPLPIRQSMHDITEILLKVA